MTRVSHALDRLEVSFDDPNLVANAGLLLTVVNGYWFLPVGGRGFSPRMARRIPWVPRGRPWFSPEMFGGLVEGLDSFAGGGLGEADGVAAGHHDVGVV